MGAGDEPSHPLEAVYRARDALLRATSEQRRAELVKQDLPSYGWALRSLLDNLADLTRVLAEQVDDIDRERLYQGTLRDHPYEVIDHAVDQLVHLRHTLDVAIRDAEQYRSHAEDLHETAEDEERPG